MMAILLQVLLLIGLALPALAQGEGWEKTWDKILRAARKEGRLVVIGPPEPELRRGILIKFKEKFGITVEYIGGRTSALAAKLRVERRARQYTADVVLGGIGTTSNVLYPEKMLHPLKPVLILPEVVDPSKWKIGKLWFMDPEEKYVLRLLNSVSRMFFINTELVKPDEIKSAQDLLNPKWRGKISSLDPSARGSGSSSLLHPLGFEFAKRLYIDQKPVFSRNSRQLADWLARGTYPISLDANSREVKRLQKEGFPIKIIYSLPDHPGALSLGYGVMSLMNNAPHPNSAAVLVNWIASREGLEFYSRTQGRATTRNDVDESFVPPEEIPVPGLKYVDNADWEFNTTGKVRFRRRMKKLLRSR